MAKKRPWMPLYIADFLLDTQHLSATETGAYLLLIMHYWMHGKLPIDDAKLARIARMDPYQWSRSKTVIKAFFVLPLMQHSRIDSELARAAEISSKRKGAAMQMHHPEGCKTGANAHTLHTSPKESKDSCPSPAAMNGTATILSIIQSDWPSNYFEQFYAAYPKKIKKQGVRKKLDQLKKGGKLHWRDLMDGTKRYAESVRGKDQQYTAAPTVWLNEGRWEDEVQPKRPDQLPGWGRVQ